MIGQQVKDAILIALATSALGVCLKFASLPQRVDALEAGFASMDKKLDILIARGQ